MIIASWLILAIAVGAIARMLVPLWKGPSTWLQLLVIGVAGCVIGVAARQMLRHVAGLPTPDLLSFVFSLLAAVAISGSLRFLFIRLRPDAHKESSSARDRRAA